MTTYYVTYRQGFRTVTDCIESDNLAHDMFLRGIKHWHVREHSNRNFMGNLREAY